MAEYMQRLMANKQTEKKPMNEPIQVKNEVEVTFGDEVDLDVGSGKGSDSDCFLMRRNRFFLIVFVTCLFIYLIVHLNRRKEKVKGSEYDRPVRGLEHIPAIFREYCQFLEYGVNGDEGEDFTFYEGEEGRRLKLRAVVVTFRHGERSPMHEIQDELACAPVRNVDRTRFARYKELMESDEYIDYFKVDEKLKNYPRVPDSSICAPGMLTAEGALQHVRLGRFFRKAYQNSKLFLHDEGYRINATVVTSQYARTLQSALAFSSEFLYKLSEFVPSVFVKAARHTHQCVDDFCDCPLSKEMREKYEEELLEYMEKDPFSREKIAPIVKVFHEFGNYSEPLHILDVSLGNYICRKKSLPCRGDLCLDFNLLKELVVKTSARAQALFDDKQGGISKRLQVIEANSILGYVAQTIDRVQRFPHTNFIKIFSGHDTVVGPILRVLGLYNNDPPHYTSRVVFEIYEHPEEGTLLRILQNGLDVTKNVEFCRDHLFLKLCKTQAFLEFFNNLFRKVGVKSMKEACHV
ncbi:unnamed protein product [Caenorhabditis auriculariae]|uniref:Uncharacterized protein n=1 Tax=Caenorhabditis auriculariae TaxID=2777116 RepID=A0A8S1H8I7_9PELO|nr:unnamed protein product [Caenorhabditis auriculariae]